jgi:hypothetical protein
MIAVILMVLMGVMSEDEARRSLNWSIYVTIACAFGVGLAMVNSGLAASIANALVKLGESLGIGGKIKPNTNTFLAFSNFTCETYFSIVEISNNSRQYRGWCAWSSLLVYFFYKQLGDEQRSSSSSLSNST